MTNEMIACQTDAGVAVVTLTRPDKRNAMTLSMWRDLAALFHRLDADPEVRAIVLTGAGKHFCAGADIAEFGAVRRNAEQSAEYGRAVESCEGAIASTHKPTIAAVSGYCMGGGCALAMACDFRIADRSAVFAIPAARMGIVYGVQQTRRLLATVGISFAKYMLFSAGQVPAEEAEARGLVLKIAAAGALDDSRSFARGLVDNAPLSIAGAKLILDGLSGGNGQLDMSVASSAQSRAAESRDYREAVTAFTEKRKPQFTGS